MTPPMEKDLRHGFLSRFYFTLRPYMPLYGGTDGGANEEAINQFYRRAICSKEKPILADMLIIY